MAERANQHRHVFRMTHYANVETILDDGAIFAKNYRRQPGYQISYDAIVNKRGTRFVTPNGEPINDFVPFYFSPITGMASAIHYRKVDLRDPSGQVIGIAKINDVVFFVASTENFENCDRQIWFTDIACNSAAQPPSYENDLSKLQAHVNWPLFDEYPIVAKIREVGYPGVCKYFADQDQPPERSNRKKERMAEFMVKDFVPLELIDCIVTKNDAVKTRIEHWMNTSDFDIPVYSKPGCYF